MRAIGLLAVLVLTACTAVGQNHERASDSSAAGSASMLAVTSPTTPGYALLEAPMTELQGLVEDWNESQARWVLTMLDSDTLSEELLEVQSEVAQRQAAVVAAMRLTVEAMPAELQEPFWLIVENYEERLQVLQTIFRSVAQGNETTLEQAGARYYELSSPAAMIQLLEEMSIHPALGHLFATEGTDPNHLIAAFRAALGVPLAEQPSTEPSGDWYRSLMEERFVAEALRSLDDTIYVDLSEELLLATGWGYCEFRSIDEPTTAAADAVALLVVYGVDVTSTEGLLEGDSKKLAALVSFYADETLCQEYHGSVRPSRPGSVSDASDPKTKSVAAYLAGADGPVPGSVGDTDRLRAPSPGEWIFLDGLTRAKDSARSLATKADQDRWLQRGYLFCIIADHLGTRKAIEILDSASTGESIVPVAFWSALYLCPDHHGDLMGSD